MSFKTKHCYLLLMLILNLLIPFYSSFCSTHTKKETLRIERKIEKYAKKLAMKKMPLFDSILYENIAPSLSAIKMALKNYVGRNLTIIPKDEQILKALKKAYFTWKSFEHDSKLDFLNLWHNYEKLGRPGKTLDYKKLWKEITTTSGFNLRFYEELYHELSKKEVLKAAHFPDPDDNRYNNKNDFKLDYLILFLAGIKNPKNNRQLTSSINARSTTKIHFSTSGNSETWFYDKRYKLYKIWEMLPKMSHADKATLLSNFIHAGKHCSVAKRWQIEDSFNLFNPAAAKELNKQLNDLAQNLDERVVLTASLEKAKVLTERVKVAVDKGKDGVLDDRFTPAEIVSENSTFIDATWDKYAGIFGLQSRQCPYTAYALNIDQKELIGPGSYTPKRLFEVIKSAHGKEILDTYLGPIQYLIKDTDLFIKGYLIKKSFISITKPEQPLQFTVAPSLSYSQELFTDDHHVIGQIQQRGRNSSVSSRSLTMPYLSEPQETSRLANLEEYPGEYEQLFKKFNYIILIDKSGSQLMQVEDPARTRRNSLLNNGRHWTQYDTTCLLADKFLTFIQKYKNDEEVPLIFFSHHANELTVKNSYELLTAFKLNAPFGSTNLYDALKGSFNYYRSDEKTMVIVLTDGAPNFGQTSKITRLLSIESSTNMKFLFVRVGEDHSAIRFLDELESVSRDRNITIYEDIDIFKYTLEELIVNCFTGHLSI